MEPGGEQLITMAATGGRSGGSADRAEGGSQFTKRKGARRVRFQATCKDEDTALRRVCDWIGAVGMIEGTPGSGSGGRRKSGRVTFGGGSRRRG